LRRRDEFSLESMPLVDREMGNWFTSAHPRSHFREHLMAARATDAGRVTLQDREITIRRRDQAQEQRLLRTHGEVVEALGTYFDLDFPSGTVFQCAALADLCG